MIREIRRSDLTAKYFEMLTQLSGVLKELSEEYINLLWGLYEANHNRITFVYSDSSSFEEPGNILGTATAVIEHKFLHNGSKVGHIEDVVVDMYCRESGVGKALVEQCVETCKQKGCYKAILDCSSKNVGFYEKCGFRITENGMRIDLGAKG